ncbi:MAG TPA: diphthamide biosynthesis enzyme Dph2 [Desulfobacteria bacterium]|nr:diphthamide biosynthesis enzyme Dph2 [Desulfobacteria bacterium]
MEHRAYEFELERIKALIRERGARRVGLQLPEGLKTVAPALAAEISSATGVDVILSGNSCYGACDLDEKLEGLVDLLFHFGHTDTFSFKKRKPVLKEQIEEKVVFIELRSTVDVKPVVERAAAELTGDCVGLVATVQHVHALAEAKDVLARAGKDAVIGTGADTVKYDGQVLGCEFSSARVPCAEILFIGSGSFHPKGIALYTGKRIIAADPFTCTINVFEPEELRKKRHIAIARALDAKSVGILISTKSGQISLSEAIALQRKAVAKGLDAYLIALDEITEDRLLGFNVDVFVNTACPRVAEDFVQFKKPVLAINEFEVVLGERSWDELWP